jgi:ribosomal protein S18 acetylase RimI-like enzyme
MEGTEKAEVTVRGLRPRDLEAVIGVDARIVGRRRDEYFKLKLEQNLKETGIQVSLAAEVDGGFVGFLLCRVFYGEFGEMEAAAVLDSFGVHPSFKGQGVGRALMAQLGSNLLGLGIQTLRTEVAWDSQDLVAFFAREGFAPAPRICLDLDLEAHRRHAAEREEGEA